MASRIPTTDAQENALNAAQVLFTANPLFLAPQTKHFLQAQQRFFDEAEKFSAAWFQRRQDAMRSMIDLGRRIASHGRGDPASAMSEIAEWQTHSMERLAEDAKDCTEMLSRCVGSVAEDEAEAVEDVSDTVKRATAPGKSRPL